MKKNNTIIPSFLYQAFSFFSLLFCNFLPSFFSLLFSTNIDSSLSHSSFHFISLFIFPLLSSVLSFPSLKDRNKAIRSSDPNINWKEPGKVFDIKYFDQKQKTATMNQGLLHKCYFLRSLSLFFSRLVLKLLGWNDYPTLYFFMTKAVQLRGPWFLNNELVA